jgi:hypothetical protein
VYSRIVYIVDEVAGWGPAVLTPETRLASHPSPSRRSRQAHGTRCPDGNILVFLAYVSVATALDNWLPEGTITREGTRESPGTTIDLVLATADLRERMVNCQVDRRVHADSDHLPIHTLIDIRT